MKKKFISKLNFLSFPPRLSSPIGLLVLLFNRVEKGVWVGQIADKCPINRCVVCQLADPVNLSPLLPSLGANVSVQLRNLLFQFVQVHIEQIHNFVFAKKMKLMASILSDYSQRIKQRIQNIFILAPLFYDAKACCFKIKFSVFFSLFIQLFYSNNF